MGDSDIGNTDDDPFETYIGSTDELEDDDSSTSSWSWLTDVYSGPVLALAAIIVATASLLGIAGSQMVGEFLSIDSSDGFTTQVASPAIDAGFATVAIVFAVLALRSTAEVRGDWHRILAAAATLVAVLSLLVNLAAVGTVLHASPPDSSSFSSSSS